MRVPFVVAIAAGQGHVVLSAIDRLLFVPACQRSYVKPEINDGTCPYSRLFYQSQTYGEIELMISKVATVDLPVESSGTDGQWDIWLLMPESLSVKDGSRALRKLRRYISGASPSLIRGGITLKKMKETMPTVYDDVFADHSWTIYAGDNHERHETAIYDPTDNDCTNDVDAEPTWPESE